MYDQSTMAARYYELCDERDAVNAKNAPLEEQLANANAEACAAQERANALAAEIDANRGHDKWIALKKEIATLARAMGRIPPRQ